MGLIDKSKSTGKIKVKMEESLQVEIHPSKGEPPHVTVFINRWGTDHRGELTGMTDLSKCRTKEEILQELGRVVMVTSHNVQNWMRELGLEPETKDPNIPA